MVGGTGGRARAGVVALVALALLLASSSAASARVPAGGAAPVTVVVDPTRCGQPQRTLALRVVCAPADVARHLRDGGAVVLRSGRHRGSLDLRGVQRVTVRGEPGAVVDAAGARYALALRDVLEVRVSGLVLRGGAAQTVWVERASDVTLDGLVVERSRGVGVHLRDTTRLRLTRSRISGAASAGVMELSGMSRSLYERLTVTGNGRGSAAYDGDGLQLSGSGVVVRDVVTTGNGSSPRYEHGIYISSRARDVLLTRITSRGNAGVAVKLGGSGRLEASTLVDDGIALYCGSTAAAGWTVRTTRLSAPSPARRAAECRWQLSR